MNSAQLPPLSDLQTEAATIAILAAKAAAGTIHEVDGVNVIVLPTGEMRSLERLRDHPLREGASVELDTIAGLIDYLRDQKHAENKPVVFADRARCSFTAFLDYHQPGAPSWLAHSAAVTLKPSKEITIWTNDAGSWKTQANMAEFLDDNLADIQTPTPADVLTFVERLEATRKETFKSAINQTTGETQFTWSKENAGNESAKIISEFTLGIPFFHRGDRIAVKAKLQHQIREVDGKGVLSFRFKIQHAEQIKDKLWDMYLNDLRLALADLPVPATLFEGAPPAAPEPVRL